MRNLIACFLMCYLLLGSSCKEHKSGEITKASNQAFSVLEIQNVVYLKNVSGEVYLPEQNTRDRVNLLNQLLEKNGFTSGQVRVVADPKLENLAIFEEAKLKNPTFYQVLKFSRGRRALRYDLSDGVIEINPQSDGI